MTPKMQVDQPKYCGRLRFGEVCIDSLMEIYA